MNVENIQDIYELSPLQQGILFHSLSAPESAVYFVQLCYALRGNFNISAFEQAWQQVTVRHTILRTSFYWENLEKPIQVVHQQVKVALLQYDWCNLNSVEQQERLKEFLVSDRASGFDFSQAPLMRLFLIRITDDSYYFVWSKHHLLLDGWSTALVLKEVIELYELLCQGENVPVAPSPDYGDYIGWLQQQDLSKAEVFWKHALSGIQAPTPLISPYINNLSNQEESDKSERIKLSQTTTAALQSLVRQHQITLNTLVQGAWAVLLGRYSGESDVVYGATVSGRPVDLIGAESIVGMFINTLPVRVKLDVEQFLIPWLKQLQAQLVELRQYEYSPLIEVQGWSEVPRGLPLFENIFVFENYPTEQILNNYKEKLEIQSISVFDKTNYPLTVTAIPGTELEIIISYDCYRFDTATITRMLGHFQTLLQGIVTDPQMCLKDLPLLTEPERHQLLVEWNGIQADYPQKQCIHQLFEAQVELTPDAIAVVFEDEQLTYCELNARANQLAHYLRSLGVKPEVLVGICVERSLSMVIGLLGILKAGGAYLPLDPAYPQERLAFMLENSQPTVLLAQQHLVENLPTYKAQVVCLDSNWELIAQQRIENPPSNITADNLAYIIYTSGSTGRPKGAMNTHQGICNRLLWMQDAYQLTATDKVLQKTPFSFDVSVWEFFWPLITGAPLVVAQPEGHRDTNYLVNLITQQQITTIHFVPSMLQVFLEAENLETCKCLKRVMASGEALPTQLEKRFFNHLDAELHNLYGPTEAGVDVTYWACVHQNSTQENSTIEQNIVPIGHPIANIQIYLLDEHLNPVPVSVRGEVYIGGVGVGRGYLNRPELTAEKFIPNPFSEKPGTRLYKTGDKARYLPNGEIEYIGRIDHQVKVRGFRIELSEIEAHLSRHPAVQETVVIVREDSGDSQRLVAYVVPQKEQTLTVTELRYFLESKLPNYMVPAAFMVLEALPLTPNGKVDRKALPAPNARQLLSESDLTAPCTAIEEILAGIWAQILGLEEVGIHDNFFTLGGHSLLATQVISQVRKVFQQELSLRRLFEQPTIAGLAKDIEKATKAGLGLETATIERISRSQHLPLSFAQQRLWFLAQLEPNSPFYNIPATVRLQGQLNLRALQQSFKEILRRHEALRTNFQTVEGQPVAVISSATSLLLPVFDINELSSNQQEASVRQLAEFEAQQPFDLNRDLLLRVKLMCLGEQEHIVLLTMHHIASDGWSTGVLIRELVTLYQAFCEQQQLSPLTELPIQYVDFAAWQRQWLQAEVLQSQISYWKKQLEGTPAVLELPTDHPRPAVQTFQGATYSFELSVERSQALNKFSQQQGSTLFMTLLAAFQTLLWRYTGNEDIVVGSPIANRNRQEIEGLIGFFVNTLVLRTNLAGNPTFEELLTRVREVALGAYAHQDLPFEQLVEQLQPQRDLSYTPLFQVMFVLQNAPMSALELPGLTLSLLESESRTAKFDLTLSLMETAQGLVGILEYNTDLFESSTISRMARHFQTLLEQIVANPQQRVSELALLTPAEKAQLAEWNDTSVEYPQQQCIHQLFESQVERTPDAVAVVFESEQLTYYELNARANQLAQYLQKLGVGPEVLVGICTERSLDMVIGLLGILKAGGAYVPLDPTYPQKRLAFMLSDSQVSVLLTQQRLIEAMPQHKAKIICLDADWQTIAQESQENLVSEVAASNLAYLIYTSGSTGKPKGVQIPHSALSNFLSAMRQTPGLSEQDTLLAVTTYSFDIAALELFLPMTVGARLVVVSREIASDGTCLSAKLTDSNATVMQATPATWQLLLAAGWQGNHQLKILCGGEALLGNLANELLNRCDSLWNMYGPTETTIWSAACLVETDGSVVPISHPIANTQLYILDQHAQLVPVGVPGELHIGGDGLARGYLNRPDLTAEKFIPSPFENSKFKIQNSKSNRLYKTGDIARYLPNGEIEFLGRIDHQVKIRGFRIELGEIEAAISQHPTVRETVVVVREDSADSQRIVAYVAPQAEQTLTMIELCGFLKSKLPNYMVPAAFVMLEALPLTPNGKVDRKTLPTPEATQLLSESNFIAPSTPIEEMLALIWTEVLGIEKVGIYNNFFTLGGHSLLATRVISQVRQVFQQELPLRRLFEEPTIAGLALDIEKALKAGLGLEAAKIERISRSQNLPLSFAQQRLWFLAQLEPNSPFYNIPAAIRLQGQLNLEALQQSFNKILHRHEALRTNFQTIEGQPVAVISPATSLPLSLLEISELSSSQQQDSVRQIAYFEAQQPFDLNSDLLLRVKLLRLWEQEHIVLLTMHHIVSDGWSTGVLVRELVAFYQAFCDNQPLMLAELPIQYVDFAAWQRQWLQADILQSQISYWCKQLEGAPSVLELPTDHVRPAVVTFAGATYSFELSQELSVAINKLSQQQGSSLFMTLLAAFQTLLWRYTGQEDIVVGSPIANRNRAEIEGLIGFFVNTLVLRTNLADNPTFRELLTRVREIALAAYAHQDLPFEQLVEELQPQRSLSHTPLFQVMFVLQNAPMSALELPGLTFSPLASESRTAKFDLTLSMAETTQGLVGTLEYNTNLFESSTISRMGGHLQTLFEGIVANPQQRLSELPLLTPAEKAQLVEWNDTQADYPQHQCIHQLFEAQVERTPDAVAVVFEDEQLTYRELNKRANQLGHYLQALGVGPEVLVGICVERSILMLIGLLGILKAGGAYVPLDPSYPQERLAFMVENAQMPVLLTQKSLVVILPESQAQIVYLDADGGEIAKQSTDNPISKVVTENLAYVIYTSGSTGRPKGVEIQHSGLLNLVRWHQHIYNLTPADRATQIAGSGFDASVWELWPYLTAGASIHIPNEQTRLSPSKLCKYLTAEAITICFLPTPLAESFLEEQCLNSLALKYLLTGGDKLHRNPRTTLPFCLVNHYGPTENTVVTTSAVVAVETETNLSPPIGRPIANAQIYLLDRYLQPVPVSVVGEIYISGVSLARGYLNRPELTAENFIPNPFSEQSATRLYKTGDLARYLPNGEIEYIGRIDHQVKVRGFRIELSEIEAHLSQHPKVRETLVVVHSASADSQDLVAYVVLQKEQTLTITELRNFLESKLPNYMIPAAFVMLEALPLSPNGKVDRKALPVPDNSRPQLEAVYQPPQTEAEKTIADIWQELLHIEDVGIHDNFFELGGHSLLLVQTHSKLQKIFQRDFPLVEMFQYPTINHLARYLSQESSEQQSFTQHSHRPESRSVSVHRRKQARKEHRAAQKGVSS
ncbi:amino acid adenylation domain-containing protein [Nostoc sp.]|uniref:amino acid adenylation domain-containing protein n=1 Tax=Nostoc sp. TaxID=1180 RepID=UPI002FF592C4